MVFYAYHKIPVLPEEQELLCNVKEASSTQGTMDEVELLEKQCKTKESVTPACTEIERIELTEKLPESHEETKSLTEEKDYLQTIKEAVRVGQDQRQEDIRETLAKVSSILSFHLISVLWESILGKGSPCVIVTML